MVELGNLGPGMVNTKNRNLYVGDGHQSEEDGPE